MNTTKEDIKEIATVNTSIIFYKRKNSRTDHIESVEVEASKFNLQTSIDLLINTFKIKKDLIKSISTTKGTKSNERGFYISKFCLNDIKYLTREEVKTVLNN